MRKIVFQGTVCDLWVEQNAKRGPKVRLLDARTHALFAIVSVDLNDEPLDGSEFVILSHAENEGLLEALVEQGVVVRTGRTVQRGGQRLEVVWMPKRVEEVA